MDDKTLIICLIVLILQIEITFSYSRRLLFDFLCGNTSKKKAKEIRQSATKGAKMFMSYIESHIKYQQDLPHFRRYHVLYIIFCVLSVAQIVTLIVTYLCTPPTMTFIWCFTIIFVINTVFFLIFRAPSWPRSPSEYSKKPGNRKKWYH